MDAAPRLAVYEDLLALDGDVRAEILGGEIIATPAPLPRHARVQRSLGGLLGKPFDDDDGRGGPGGWWILTEVDVRLGTHDIVRPDLSGWHRLRLPAPWDERPIDTRPDWVCEILSPSNARHDRVHKRALYAQYEVPYYWIVDPEARTLEALALEGGRWVEVGAFDETAVARIAPFEAVAIELAPLFPPPARTDAE
ncbi:MAG: Uma2 family endonuclease [Myxococcales bacterium]|nr:Uma2 family endonuclease [Myxococcales bacterium]